MISFLSRAGNHQISLGQSQLLSLDARAHRVGLFDLLQIEPRCQQSSSLLASEGVTRENQRNTQTSTDHRPDEAGIGVMGMQPIDRLTRAAQMLHQAIGQLLKMRPEQLLAEIALWSAGKSENACPRDNRLLGAP